MDFSSVEQLHSLEKPFVFLLLQCTQTKTYASLAFTYFLTSLLRRLDIRLCALGNEASASRG